ncbi:MAG: aminoglycoside phosphotransferase family protein, partial [Bacteroidota bacterium]|nr:aminoglycoside phosphotransferase family protein [Bacteroidota bacterium]
MSGKIADPLNTKIEFLEEHSAVQMWRELVGKNSIPCSINKLKINKRKEVYRLNGVGPSGYSVIGKRALRSTLSIERIVYEKILPQIPSAYLKYYGFIEEKESDFCWLFIEEAPGVPYSELNGLHRALASNWLAIMNVTTAHLPPPNLLPIVSYHRHLSCLNMASDIIIKYFTHPVLTKKDTAILENIIGYFTVIKNHWDEVSGFCDSLPLCLIHGDFYGKNIHVNEKDCNPELYVMDWEAAGWGIPAEDFGELDVGVYWSVVKNLDFPLTLQNVQWLSNFGLMFKYINLIQGTTIGFEKDWIEGAIGHLAVYD